METFEIIYPSPLLASYVKYYWILEADHSTGVMERIIPTGNIHLVFHKGGRMYSSYENDWHPRSFLCGQNTIYTDLSSSEKINMIVVVFQPYGAKAFFPMSMNDFRQINVSVGDLSDKELQELEKYVLNTSDNGSGIKLIESFLIKRLYTAKSYNYRRVGAVIREINQTQGGLNIKQLADVSCLSAKQFNRIFSEYVGTNPKEFLRIIRFQRALYSLQTQQLANFTELAYLCGFSDQSHLIKEFKSLSGYTPREYLSVCAPYSDYFSEH